MVDDAGQVERPLAERLPGPDWRERCGPTGIPAAERRGSPIVELSLLLVRGSSVGVLLPGRSRQEAAWRQLQAAWSVLDVEHPVASAQAECVQHGRRTLAFCKTRKLCELVTAYTRETLRDTAPHLASTISVYRGGYSPQATTWFSSPADVPRLQCFCLPPSFLLPAGHGCLRACRRRYPSSQEQAVSYLKPL